MTVALITNDDGIESEGLHRLAAYALDAGLDVIIAAPARQSSGSSASIIAAEENGRIPFEPHPIEGLDVPSFSVRGAPGLISLIAAHGAFVSVPDLVLSGINHGANVGRAILHSGTVGAALTAGLNGARAIAVSLDVGMTPERFEWDAAARVTVQQIPRLLDSPAGTVWNLNVPNESGPFETREAALAPFGIVQTSMSEQGEGFVRMAVEDLPNTPEPGSDAALLAQGFATVTNIQSVSGIPLARG